VVQPPGTVCRPICTITFNKCQLAQVNPRDALPHQLHHAVHEGGEIFLITEFGTKLQMGVSLLFGLPEFFTTRQDNA